jgi:mannose-6-phosphate isomerase-like protein (cupin superfamily)
MAWGDLGYRSLRSLGERAPEPVGCLAGTHHHQNEDELFLVLQGKLTLELRDGAVHLRPGEFFIVPRGVEHRPVAEEEVHLLMFEPASTLNTGNIRNERTVEKPRRI